MIPNFTLPQRLLDLLPEGRKHVFYLAESIRSTIYENAPFFYYQVTRVRKNKAGVVVSEVSLIPEDDGRKVDPDDHSSVAGVLTAYYRKYTGDKSVFYNPDFGLFVRLENLDSTRFRQECKAPDLSDEENYVEAELYVKTDGVIGELELFISVSFRTSIQTKEALLQYLKEDVWKDYDDTVSLLSTSNVADFDDEGETIMGFSCCGVNPDTGMWDTLFFPYRRTDGFASFSKYIKEVRILGTGIVSDEELAVSEGPA